MGRILRIVIYVFIILVLYFWITAVVESYNKKKMNNKPQEYTSDAIDSLTLLGDTLDTFVSDTLVDYDPAGGDNIVDYDEVDETINEFKTKIGTSQKVSVSDESPQSKPTDQVSKPSAKGSSTVASPPQVIAGDGGNYLVMAGSYIIKDNAKTMVNKLRKLGYKNAEIIVFAGSQYHAVVAVRYKNEGDAMKASNALKSKGVDSFVKANQ